MRPVYFRGRIHPYTFKVNYRSPTINWIWGDKNKNLSFQTIIENSTIEVKCLIDNFLPEYFMELYKRASDLAQGAVSMMIFAHGANLDVRFDTFIDNLGYIMPIMFVDNALAQLCTAFKINDPEYDKDFGEFYAIIVTDNSIRQAIFDLTRCACEFNVAPINCGRVIESIAKLINPATNEKRKTNWISMQQSLNISRDYQEWISSHSTGPRHADPTFVSGEICVEITKRTWTIFNRFLHYRKGGNAPLSTSEFPIL